MVETRRKRMLAAVTSEDESKEGSAKKQLLQEQEGVPSRPQAVVQGDDQRQRLGVKTTTTTTTSRDKQKAKDHVQKAIEIEIEKEKEKEKQKQKQKQTETETETERRGAAVHFISVTPSSSVSASACSSSSSLASSTSSALSLKKSIQEARNAPQQGSVWRHHFSSASLSQSQRESFKGAPERVLVDIEHALSILAHKKLREIDFSSTTYPKFYKIAFDVFVEQQLSVHAFFRAMHIFDSTLALWPVKRHKALLILCASIMLACKFEEIYPPCLDWLFDRFSFTFSYEELFNMERRIFQLLAFDVSFPTRYEFSLYFAHYQELSEIQHNLYLYFLFFSFLDYNLNYYSCSHIAAAALHLTLQLTARNTEALVWTDSLKEATGYNEDSLVDVVVRLRKIHWNVRNLGVNNLVDYFSTEQRFQVSDISALQYKYLYFVMHGRHVDYMLPKNEDLLELPDFSTF